MLFYSRLHQDFFSTAPDFNYCYHLLQRVDHKECTHSIESISTLEKLLTEKPLQKEDPVLRLFSRYEWDCLVCPRNSSSS